MIGILQIEHLIFLSRLVGVMSFTLGYKLLSSLNSAWEVDDEMRLYTYNPNLKKEFKNQWLYAESEI